MNCKCHCHNRPQFHGGTCRCIKNCIHCHPENFKPMNTDPMEEEIHEIVCGVRHDTEIIPVCDDKAKIEDLLTLFESRMKAVRGKIDNAFYTANGFQREDPVGIQEDVLGIIDKELEGK